MDKVIRWTYKIIRLLLVSLLVAAAIVPVLLFVGLSLPPIQNRLRSIGETELTNLLGSPVSIGRVDISPFSSVTLDNVTVADSTGRNALEVARLGAGIDLWSLLGGNIRVSYVEILGLKADIYKSSPQAPLNIQPIIDRFKPKDKTKPPTRFDLAISTVVIRKSELHYNVLSTPYPADARFTPDHISLYDLRADITMPRLSNDDIRIDLLRMAFSATGGLKVTSLAASAVITPDTVTVSDFELALPHTRIAVDNTLSLPLHSPVADIPAVVQLAPGCRVTPADFSAFLPALTAFDLPVPIALSTDGTISNLKINNLEIGSTDLPVQLAFSGSASGLTDGVKALSADINRLELAADMQRLTPLMAEFDRLKPGIIDALSAAGQVSLSVSGSGSITQAAAKGTLAAAPGALEFDVTIARPANSSDLTAHLFTEGINLGAVKPELEQFGSPGLDADITFSYPDRRGSFSGTLSNLGYNGHTFAPLESAFTIDGNLITAKADVDDPLASLSINADAELDADAKSANINAEVRHIDLNALGLAKNYAGYTLSALIRANASGSNIDDLSGHISLSDFEFADISNSALPSLELGRVDISATTDSLGRQITLDSDIATAELTGNFRFATLPQSLRNIALQINPELFPGNAQTVATTDSLTLRLTVEPDNPLGRFIKLPVGIIAPINLVASLDSHAAQMSVDLSAPYLQQKDKLIEGTALHIDLFGHERAASLAVSSVLPSKGGPVNFAIDSHGIMGRHDTKIEWSLLKRPNYGNLSFTTSFSRDTTLTTRIDINPGRIVFNDTVWTVAPSSVIIADRRVTVDNFTAGHDNQLLAINGEASADPGSTLLLTLREIDLDYVFDTLNIPNVSFGGTATGTFHASSLFTKTPVAYTDNLFVRNLSYNKCVFGDGRIRSAWHPEAAGDITIDAEILEPGGYKSYINGSIHPTKELLDFRFKADHAPVGFLKPFMAAFCTGIRGYASGDCHLYGTFKLLDMTGEVYAQNLEMDLGITNTTYHCTDSVHISPGLIELRNITIADDNGMTARLNGRLTHKDFKEPRFNFHISDARNLLSYDIKESSEHPWYGKVYGTGAVNITGEPGHVDIGVDIATAPGTDFTFVLSDSEVAADYDFITFHDVTPPEVKKAAEETTNAAAEPAMLRALRERIRKQQELSEPTDYTMTFNIDVTPRAKINLVMDPVGGDKIQATGHGTLNMSYDSLNDEVKMYGTYTLEQGTYNFTLQDIIIKEFTIEEGSSISFHGDPYSAILNIRAHYSLNANLSDLDESFLQDRELNRTNVPVHAVMIVSGDMRSPDINFDLAFPTLSSDTYRKVRSIVSTDDMMNRQIIYLLALNRFYTPDYMDATRGNELVSVASSTISSQLSNMLGQLSDKFSIAPSIRSDRGDFSDVEVDVALSSHLLNNRLLLNGNFGYRDKSLNSNSFIGDFDIEYLLNRSGSLRLKAYNRYNDQNYYLKSALTTQGVGVVFKRDFDYMFDFWYRLRRKLRKSKPAQPSDSISSPDHTTNGKPATD